jgi:hypothetical protein
MRSLLLAESLASFLQSSVIEHLGQCVILQLLLSQLSFILPIHYVSGSPTQFCYERACSEIFQFMVYSIRGKSR